MKKFIRDLLKNIRIAGLKLQGVSVGENTNIKGKILVKNKQKGEISIGSNSTIISGEKYNPIGFQCTMTLYVIDKGKIRIGNNVGISNSCVVSKSCVSIEDDVMIGGGVKIYDTDFHSLNYQTRVSDFDNDVKSSPILIKKGAFIGAGSIILKGVVIGEKSVVGAGSVVTRNIPNGEIWAGNPAKFIRKI